MNHTRLETKLIAAARNHSPSDRVPYAFEKRVMAYISSRPVVDELSLWAQALWRSAGACLAVVGLLATLWLVSERTHASSRDLSRDFEQTMLAAVDGDYSR